MTPASGLQVGFSRQRQPNPPPVVISINDAVEAELALLIGEHFPPRDPFKVADRCPRNETGHQPITSCGEIVCAHCAKVIWR